MDKDPRKFIGSDDDSQLARQFEELVAAHSPSVSEYLGQLDPRHRWELTSRLIADRMAEFARAQSEVESTDPFNKRFAYVSAAVGELFDSGEYQRRAAPFIWEMDRATRKALVHAFSLLRHEWRANGGRDRAAYRNARACLVYAVAPLFGSDASVNDPEDASGDDAEGLEGYRWEGILKTAEAAEQRLHAAARAIYLLQERVIPTTPAGDVEGFRRNIQTLAELGDACLRAQTIASSIAEQAHGFLRLRKSWAMTARPRVVFAEEVARSWIVVGGDLYAKRVEEFIQAVLWVLTPRDLDEERPRPAPKQAARTYKAPTVQSILKSARSACSKPKVTHSTQAQAFLDFEARQARERGARLLKPIERAVKKAGENRKHRRRSRSRS